MRENRDFVVPVNILTPFARTPFSWAARHTTVCLDYYKCIMLYFEVCFKVVVTATSHVTGTAYYADTCYLNL